MVPKKGEALKNNSYKQNAVIMERGEDEDEEEGGSQIEEPSDLPAYKQKLMKISGLADSATKEEKLRKKELELRQKEVQMIREAQEGNKKIELSKKKLRSS